MRLLLSLLATLVLAAPASASGFQVGIVDSTTMAVNDISALGLTTERVTLRWNGESNYTGNLQLTPGLRPLLLVGMVYDKPPYNADQQVAYCSFVNSVLQRYPIIKDVMVWGEAPPSSSWGWYVSLLRVCSPMIRAHGARVIGPIVGPWVFDNPQPLYSALSKAPHLIDGSGGDPYYGDSKLKNYIQGLRSAVGWRVPFYVAEDGIDTVPDSINAWMYNGYTPPSWKYWTTENGQAQVLATHMTTAYCAGVDFWANFLLKDETNLVRWQSGLEHPNGSHKPAYAAMAKTSHLLQSGAYKCPTNPPPPPPPPSERMAYESSRQTSDLRDRVRHANCVRVHGRWVCPQRHP